MTSLRLPATFLLIAGLCLGAAPASAQQPVAPPATVPPEALPRPDLAPAEPTPAAPEASEVDPSRITEVRVEGNVRVEAAAVRRAITQQVGQVFDEQRTGDDLRALWALKYFQDIQLLVQRLPRGIVYVVRVKERPSVREVRYEGNKEISEDDMKELVDVKPGQILDLEPIRRTTKKVGDKYVEKGFFLADVTHRIEPVPDALQVEVVLVIRENAKVSVKEIHLLGAEQVKPEEIKEVMATKEGGLLAFLTGEGTYREELFQRDQMAIQSLYYDRGLINVRVDKPVLTMSADKRHIYISIRIEEGEQYRIGKLDVGGDLVAPREELLAKMETKPGDLFNRTRLSKDILALTDVFYDQGYAYANITPVTAVNAEAKTVDLTFEAQKGKKVAIERINIVGNTKTRDKVIRREVRVYEGELFSGTGMRRSRERVTALGFFETVDVTHKPGRDDSHVIVQVDVKEKPTGTFQLGFGYSGYESFIFTAQVSQSNFLGWGNSLSASAQISGLRSIFQLSYFDPYFLDTNYIFSIDLSQNQIDRFDYERHSIGGSLTGGYHVFEDVMVNLTYTLENVRLQAGQATTNAPSGLFRGGVTSSLRLSGTWDRRDNRLFPTAGFMHHASVEYAPPFLGGSLLFARYSAFSRFYQPLPFGLVFKTNLTVGYIQNLDPVNPIPIGERYQLGGINSVRGYRLSSICPRVTIPVTKEPDAIATTFCEGGNKQFIANVELEFTVFEKVGVRGVLFYDAGNAFAADERFFQDRVNHPPLGLLHSVGFGFRWFSPVGPLRFEWGIPLTRRPIDDQPIVFEFTIGNFF